jgi:hypothetical protein
MHSADGLSPRRQIKQFSSWEIASLIPMCIASRLSDPMETARRQLDRFKSTTDRKDTSAKSS